MRDIWAFLLQTLTASGAAVLLLILKAIFKDKLSPRWQFGIWGLLGLVLLFPAGLTGRFTLLNWPLWLETVKTLLTGQYTLTRVIAPIPLLPAALPHTVADWLFVIYLLGVLAALLWHLVSYLQLRAVLRSGTPVSDAAAAQIRAVAERCSLPLCRAIQVPGLSSAFLCGLFRPVLVLPAGVEPDDKVLLHELLHLKHRDVVWSVVICLLRCIHWCNPLLWYCADRAGNDLEARCDQRVLERLEGEERREYGRILLSMANEKYARTAGTTSVANGGKNIRRRIEAIARFKLYPAGMALVSVCMAVLLAAPLLIGAKASAVRDFGGNGPMGKGELALASASARTVWCTTPAGALDTYGKALLTRNGIYRAMCAPLSAQETLLTAAEEDTGEKALPQWDIGIDSQPNESAGYYIFGFDSVDGGYEALMAIQLMDRPDRGEAGENTVCLAMQTVRVEREGPRWIVTPQEELHIAAVRADFLIWNAKGIPCRVYAAEAENFRIELHLQSRYVIDNTVEVSNGSSWAFGSSTRFDTVPKPDARFDRVTTYEDIYAIWTGSDEEKNTVQYLGISSAPASDGEARPLLQAVTSVNSSGSSSDGTAWASQYLRPGWDSPEYLSGSGGDFPAEMVGDVYPDYYAADLYVNCEKVAELELRPEEGGAS